MLKDADHDRIDDAVLALMYLTLHGDPTFPGAARAWKSFDWDALGRLHARGDIFEPVGKAKSVGLTPAGVERCKALFVRLFVDDTPP